MYNKGGRLEKRASKLKSKSDKLKSEIGTVQRKVNVGSPDSMGMQGVTEKTFSNPTDKQKRKGNRLNKRSARVAGRMKDGGAKKMMGGGMPNQSFLESSTPRMFEDGGLKDLRKKQRDERRVVKDKNKASRDLKRGVKKDVRKIIKSARKNTRGIVKKIKSNSRENIRDVKKDASPKIIKREKNSKSKNDNVIEKITPKGGTIDVKNNKPVIKALPKAETFGQAYARNRKAGKKVFTWKGKKYTTESKSEKSKRDGSAKMKSMIKKDDASIDADDAKTSETMNKEFLEDENRLEAERKAKAKAKEEKRKKAQTLEDSKRRRNSQERRSETTGAKKGTYTGVEGGNYSVDPDTGEVTETDAQKAERKRKAAEALRRRRSSYQVNKGGQKVYSKIG